MHVKLPPFPNRCILLQFSAMTRNWRHFDILCTGISVWERMCWLHAGLIAAEWEKKVEHCSNSVKSTPDFSNFWQSMLLPRLPLACPTLSKPASNANALLHCTTFSLSKQKILFIIVLRNGNRRVAHQCLLAYSTLTVAPRDTSDINCCT